MRRSLERWCILSLLVAALTGASSGAHAQEMSYTSQELVEADQAIDARLSSVTDSQARVAILGHLALVERPGGALEHEALVYLEREGQGVPGVLLKLFQRVGPYGQATILKMYREHWSTLGMHTNSWRDETVRRGLASPSAEVRAAAAELAATRPLPRILHHAIDAAVAHPELTEAAMFTVATNQDFRGVRWVIELSAKAAPERRELGLWVVRRVGEPAKRLLFERIDDPDPDFRAFALDALLQLASPEDESVLHGWIERWRKEDPQTAERVLKVLAALESGSWRPPPFEQRLFKAPSARPSSAPSE